MKLVSPTLNTYRKVLDAATVTGNLTRRITHFTGATGQTLTLPNASGTKKEFIVVNTSGNTVTVAAPTNKMNTGTSAATTNSLVTTGTTGHFQAVGTMWYRI